MGQRHVCTLRHALRAAYRTAISAAQILVKLSVLNNKLLRILQHKSIRTPNIELYKTYSALPVHLLHNFQILIYIHLYSSKNDSNQTNKKERKTRQRTQYRKYSNVHAYIT